MKSGEYISTLHRKQKKPCMYAHLCTSPLETRFLLRYLISLALSPGRGVKTASSFSFRFALWLSHTTPLHRGFTRWLHPTRRFHVPFGLYVEVPVGFTGLFVYALIPHCFIQDFITYFRIWSVHPSPVLLFLTSLFLAFLCIHF